MEQSFSSVSNPDQELQYIRGIMAESRKALAEDGKPYIMWGLIVALGMIDSYVSALLQTDLASGWVWMGLVLIGYVYIFYYMRKKKREAPRVKSFIDRLQGAIWTSVGSTIGLTVLLITIKASMNSGDLQISPFYICFFTALLTGIGYFLSGFALDIKWLRNIGYAWWALSIVMFWWSSIHVLGLYALAMICFQVVPGIILNRKYRELQHSGAVVGA